MTTVDDQIVMGRFWIVVEAVNVAEIKGVQT
jgi:hypothetical protein